MCGCLELTLKRTRFPDRRLLDRWETLVWSPRGEHARAPSNILSLFPGFQYFQDELMEKMK